MRDRVERIMKEGLQCDCCSAEIKALSTEWVENRENTLKTKEIADKLTRRGGCSQLWQI